MVGLFYPSESQVGMANLGYRIILDRFEKRCYIEVRRVFLERDRRRGVRLVFPDGPVEPNNLDLAAFSISYEPDIINAVEQIHLLGISFSIHEREENHPVVLIGGAVTFMNPVPLSVFADLIFIGEAENSLERIFDVCVETRGIPRSERLHRYTGIPGIWNTSVKSNVPERIHVPVKDIHQKVFFEAKTGIFGGAGLVEVTRGCPRGCRFCAPGYIYLPYRNKKIKDILSLFETLPLKAKIGLVGTSISDYPPLKDLLRRIHDMGFMVSISSLRADRLDKETAELLRKGGLNSLTIAPEAGSQRLRDAVGKSLFEDDILGAADNISRAGFSTLRLYFIIGLPWETRKDIVAIHELVKKIRKIVRPSLRLVVSVSPFIPKPMTPFQWAPMDNEQSLRSKLKLLKKLIEGENLARVSNISIREAIKEAIIAQGDERIGKAIHLMVTSRKPFKKALKDCGINLKEILREKTPTDCFPWDFICSHNERKRFLSIYQKAKETACKEINLSGQGIVPCS